MNNSEVIRNFQQILLNDHDYRRSFIDNIAMCYLDNAYWYRARENKQILDRDDYLNIARSSAEEFMARFISPVMPKTDNGTKFYKLIFNESHKVSNEDIKTDVLDTGVTMIYRGKSNSEAKKNG